MSRAKTFLALLPSLTVLALPAQALDPGAEKYENLLTPLLESSETIVGQREVIERLVIGLLANGNLLIEGLPGLAKTRAVKALDAALILLAPACSQLALAGRAAGLRVVDEIFADRLYQDDGQLLPRSQPGAVIHDPGQALAHVRAMLDAGALVSASGHQIPVQAGSICIHGDSPDAVALARQLRDGLRASGYSLAPLTAMPAP